MIGAITNVNVSSSLTLTRRAEQSAEQAELRAQQLQRESQRLESEADRTQRNAERLYNRADETESEAQSLLSRPASESGSVDARQPFPQLNPLQDSNRPSEPDITASVPVVVEPREAVASLSAYSPPSNPAPGSLVSERV